MELVEEEFCGGAVGFEAEAAGGEQRAEAADADAFVGVVVDQPGVDAEDTEAAEAVFELGCEEFLVLVGLDAEEVGLELAVDFDAVVGHAGAITPVPGGVGPLTIAMLLKNTLDAAERSVT